MRIFTPPTEARCGTSASTTATSAYINSYSGELSDEERQALTEKAEKLRTGSKETVADLREKSKVKNLQLVYIFEDPDSVIAAVVCDE